MKPDPRGRFEPLLKRWTVLLFLLWMFFILTRIGPW